MFTPTMFSRRRPCPATACRTAARPRSPIVVVVVVVVVVVAAAAAAVEVVFMCTYYIGYHGISCQITLC